MQIATDLYKIIQLWKWHWGNVTRSQKRPVSMWLVELEGSKIPIDKVNSTYREIECPDEPKFLGL